MFEPWHYLREMFPHVKVHFADLGDDGGRTSTDGKHIWLHWMLTLAGIGFHLTHEIMHLIRGPSHTGPHQWREERICNHIAAVQCIPIDKLADALRWTHRVEELAEELHTTEHAIHIRINNLSRKERDYIHNKLNR